MTAERWLPVRDYENLYEVGYFDGQILVKSLARTVPRRGNKPKYAVRGCILNPGSRGRVTLSCRARGERRTMSVYAIARMSGLEVT